MTKLKEFLSTYQQQIVLTVGYLLVAGLAFGIGRFTVSKTSAPTIAVEQAFTPPNNYTANQPAVQSAVVTQTSSTQITNCDGKIKGASSMIYHIPGDAFYNRTTKPV